MRVLLTGGTGCIGSHVAQELRTRGHQVIALVRPSSNTRRLQELGAELAVADLRDRMNTELAIVGRRIDAVVHAAGPASTDLADYEHTGIRGTQHLLIGMAAALCKRLIVVSSVAAYGTEPWRKIPIDENTPVSRHQLRLHPYVRQKVAIEDAVLRAHSGERVAATILRAGLVFGERDRRVLPAIFSHLMRKPEILPAGGRNRVAFVAAEDLARAVLLALEQEASQGMIYDIASSEPANLADLTQRVAHIAGMEAPFLRVPRSLFVWGTYAASYLQRRFLPAASATLDPCMVELLCADFPLTGTRARQHLGFAPRVRLDDMLRSDIAYQRAQHEPASSKPKLVLT